MATQIILLTHQEKIIKEKKPTLMDGRKSRDAIVQSLMELAIIVKSMDISTLIVVNESKTKEQRLIMRIRDNTGKLKSV